MQEDEKDQQTFQQALRDNTTFGNDGQPKVDWDSALNQAGPQMRLRNVQSIQRDHLMIQQAARQLAMSNVQADKDKLEKAQLLNTAAGRELAYIDSLPEDEKGDQYPAALDRMKMVGYDTSTLPATYPGGDAGKKLVEAGMMRTGYFTQHIKDAQAYADAKRKEQDETRKDLQDRVAAGAARLSTANSGDEYSQILSSMGKDVQARFAPLPKDSDPSQPIDPDFLENVRQRGLTAKEQDTSASRSRGLDILQQQADAATERAKAAGGVAGLAQRAYDPTRPAPERQADLEALQTLQSAKGGRNGNASPGQAAVQGRFDTRELDRWSQELTKLQDQERKQWQTADSYRAPIMAGDGKPVVDPDTRQTVPSMDQAHRDYYSQKAKAATDAANAIHTQADGIMKRFGWGQYGQAGDQPPANTPPGNAPPKPLHLGQQVQPKSITKNGKTYTEGQQVKLKNGKTVTIDKLNDDGTFSYRQ